MRRLAYFACFACLFPYASLAASTLSNTPVTEAQISRLFQSRQPALYYCQTGIFDDLGNLDGDWGQPPSPGRITSAAWDLGNGNYLYAYQLTNPNFLDDDVPYYGGWDVAVSGHSGYLSVPLRQLHVIPVDYDGDNVLDSSFRITTHACTAAISSAGWDCSPFTGPFSAFTTGADPCANSWSDYYRTYPGGVSNDAIVEALEDLDGTQVTAKFAVEYDPLCCAHGVFASSQVFGFVSDAPPAFVDGHNLGGTSSSIRLVAPVPRALLVHGFCGSENDWVTYAQVLVDSGYVVDVLHYGSTDHSQPPGDYVQTLRAKLDAMGADHIAVVAHSMGGLIAREYMRQQVASGAKNKIAKLVTLGTPHHGSELASGLLSIQAALNAGPSTVTGSYVDVYATLKRFLPCQASPLTRGAITDMSPGSRFLNKLNYGATTGSYDSRTSHGWSQHYPESTLPPYVPVSAIAGTYSFCDQYLPVLTSLFWGKGTHYHPNDGVVAVRSANMVTTAVHDAKDINLSLGSAVTHASNGLLCGPPYYSSNDLAERTATLLLHGTVAGVDMFAMRPARLGTAADTDSSAADSLVTAPGIVDTISSGTVAHRSVTVPSTSAMYVLLISQDARLSITSPSGTTITPPDTTGTGGITYCGTPGSGLEGFEVDNPNAGVWGINVDAALSDSAQTYGVLLFYASPYAAALDVLQSPISEDDSLRIRASLTNGGAPAVAATWQCRMVRPDNSTAALTLYDDGLHSDGLANDGTFGGSVAPGGGDGDYHVIGVASLPDGESFVASDVCRVQPFADLAIDSTDIAFFKNVVEAGDSAIVLATVHNRGTSPELGVVVTATDQLTFDTLGSSTVDIAAGSSALVQIPWHVAAPDTHRIQISIAPSGSATEANYANNVTARSVVLGQPVEVKEPGAQSSQLWFAAPRPNPSRGSVILAFRLPEPENAALDVFDVLGRRMHGWQWSRLSAGPHSVEWDGVMTDGRMSPPGVYLCRLRVRNQMVTQKFVLRR